VLPRSRVKTPSNDVPEALLAPIADMKRITEFLHSHHRLNPNDATQEYLQIVREGTQEMGRLIKQAQVFIALEHVMARHDARETACNADNDEATSYFKVPMAGGDGF
jgi:hypothetical protein